MQAPDAAFIRSLPKTETHLHIEGALPYHLLHSWDPVRWGPDPEFRRAEYRYPTFPHFEKVLLDHALPWFTSAERYHEAAKVLFAEIAAQGVRYIETSFHLPVTQFIGVPGREIVHAIRSAAPVGVEVRVFTGMPRDAFQGPLALVIQDLGTWSELSGVDLHGFEAMPTESWTAPVWERLRGKGKITKCHAGEFDGAARVREAILTLGCDRIQHGVRAVEDPEVLRLAADRGVTFDVCPISNVRLQVVPSMRQHPLRTLMQAGIRCTVSTDDPLCFANTVCDEYAALAVDCGFTRAELCRIARAGWELALVDPALRSRALAEIAALEAGSSSC
jgi:adenosine deaminase